MWSKRLPIAKDDFCIDNYTYSKHVNTLSNIHEMW